MSYSPNGAFLLMSALEDGQLDLYRYDVVANNQRPWRDQFDDLHPAFWGRRRPFSPPTGPTTPCATTGWTTPSRNLDLYVGNERRPDYPGTLDPYPRGGRASSSAPSREIHLPPKRGRLDTRLGLGWRDSSIVAIDTVVRYEPSPNSATPWFFLCQRRMRSSKVKPCGWPPSGKPNQRAASPMLRCLKFTCSLRVPDAPPRPSLPHRIARLVASGTTGKSTTETTCLNAKNTVAPDTVAGAEARTGERVGAFTPRNTVSTTRSTNFKPS